MSNNISFLGKSFLEEKSAFFDGVEKKASSSVTDATRPFFSSAPNPHEEIKALQPLTSQIPMSKEEVHSYSLLHNQPRYKLPDLSREVLNHEIAIGACFLGAGLVTGGKDNPIQVDSAVKHGPNLRVWESLLVSISDELPVEATDKKEFLATLLKSLRQLLKINEKMEQVSFKNDIETALAALGLELTQQASLLAKGESLRFFGGWKDKTQQSTQHLLYEIERSENGLFNFYVYNPSQQAMGCLVDKILIDNKWKMEPLICYENIPEETLFFKDKDEDGVRPGFFQSLLELYLLPDSNNHSLVKTDEDHLLTVLDLLNPYKRKATFQEQGAITGARVNNDVTIAIKQWIRRQTSGQKTYKQLLFMVKFKLLLGLYQALQKTISEDSQKGNQARSLLRQCAQKLLRRTAKLGGDQGFGMAIDVEMARSAQATAYELLGELDLCERKIAKARGLEYTSLMIDDFNFDEQRSKRASIRSPSSLENVYFADLFGKPVADLIEVDSDSPWEFLDKLDFGSDTSLAKRMELHHIIDQLELPFIEDASIEKGWVDRVEAGDWATLDKADAEERLRQLLKLSEDYLLYHANQDSPTRAQATFLTLHTLVHYLALLIDSQETQGKPPAARLESYGLPFFGRNLGQIEALVYYDLNEHKRVQQALSYFEAFNDKKTEFLFQKESSTSIQNGIVLESPFNHKYWQALYTTDESLKRLIESEFNNEYPDIDIEEDYRNELKKYNDEVEGIKKRQRLYPSITFFIPRQPEKKVNLSLETKIAAVMEGGNFLSISKPHIASLRLMTQISKVFMTDRSFSRRDFGVHGTICRRNPFADRVELENKSATEGSIKQSFKTSPFDLLHKRLLDKHKSFLAISQTHRCTEDWLHQLAEGEALQLTHKDPFLLRLLRVLSEWQIAPYQLISEFKQELDQLKDTSMQGLFNILFFRSVVEFKGSGCSQLGVGQLIIEDDALLNSCIQFIQEGLAHFGRQKDGINGAVFFFELTFFLSKYLVDHGLVHKLPKLIEKVNIADWLLKVGPDNEQASLLHLYRLLMLSLDRENLDLFEKETIMQIYESWVTYRMRSSITLPKSPIVERAAAEAVLKITSLIRKIPFDSSEFLIQVCKRVISSLGLDRDDQLKWEMSSLSDQNTAIFNADKSGGGFWEVDLVEGSIKNETGTVTLDHCNPSWESDPEFERIFNHEKGFSYKSLGWNLYSFTHPQLGTFKIKKTDTSFVLQKQLLPGNGTWFTFAMDQTPGVPKILMYDHLFWISDENHRSHTSHIGYFTCLKSQMIKFALNSEGQILERHDDADASFSHARIVDYLHTTNGTNTLQFFDDPQHILTYSSPLENLEEIALPRYVSNEGNPLFFKLKEKQLVWGDNEHYILPKQAPKGCLGTCYHYLYLTKKDKKGVDKLLVPFQKVSQKEKPLPNGNLKIRNFNKLVKKNNEQWPAEQWGCFTYFTYDVEGGQLKPTTQEGRYFLAYLYQSQRRYEQAIRLMMDLNRGQPLSEISFSVISMIAKAPDCEDHPEAKMVKACADLLCMQHIDLTEEQQPQSHFYDLSLLWKSAKRYEAILQSYNNIAAGCRMKSEDELYYLGILIQECESAKQNLCRELVKETSFDKIVCALKHRFKAITELKTDEEELAPILEEGREYPKKFAPGHFRGDFSFFITFDLPRFNLQKPLENHFKYKTLTEKRKDGSTEDSYEEALNRYNAALTAHRNRLEGQLEWLKQGQMAKLYTRSSKVTTNKNGNMLLEVLAIAKGSSQGARKQMLFRLLQWRLTSNERDKEYLDLMIGMLYQPDNFPDPIDINNATLDEKVLFLSKYHEDNWSDLNLKGCTDGYDNTHLQRRKPQDLFEEVFWNTPEKQKEDAPIQIKPAHSHLIDFNSNLSNIAPDKIDLLIPSYKESGLVAHLQQLKESCCSFIPALQLPQEDDFKITYRPGMLSEDEKDHEKSLRRDLDLLKEDYDEGKKQNEGARQLQITQENCVHLKKELEQLLEQFRNQLQQKTTHLLDKVNQKPLDQQERLIEMALIGGGVKKELDLSDCVDALLSGDQRSYTQKNKQLSSANSVNEIVDLTLQVEDLKANQAQLNRLIALCKDIAAIPDQEDPTRIYFCQKLEAELDARHHLDGFSDEVQVALRVFSGQTGILPHEKQIRLIAEMLKMREKEPKRYKDLVIQLIMGGGKTSVIAVVILYLSAMREGRLGVFIVPPSLYSTVRENFSESFRNAFNKETLGLDIDRKSLSSYYSLKRTYDLLEKAKKQHLPLIAKATSVQCIELELLTSARRLKSCYQNKKKNEKQFNSLTDDLKKQQSLLNTATQEGRQGEAILLKEQIERTEGRLKTLKKLQTELQKEAQNIEKMVVLLYKTSALFARSADALFDEVHCLLDALQEVNFPSGDSVPIEASANSLLQLIFGVLTSDTIKVGSLPGQPTVAQVSKLRLNDQESMMKDASRPYQRLLVPIIAKHLLQNFPLFKEYFIDFEPSFIRYISGTMPSFIQRLVDSDEPLTEALVDNYSGSSTLYSSFAEVEDDVTFLKNLKNMYKTGNKSKQQVANCTALARHFLKDLLPATLSKSGQRNYGRLPNGDIIPYLGVNRPATTEFGYHFEKAAYYYQYASSFPITQEEVLNIAEASSKAAYHYVHKNGEAFCDTCEYQDFLRWFGVPLDKIDEPAVLKKACENISNDIEKRLQLVYELVAINVSYRSERHSSNGMALVDLFHSRRTMSGTPKNVEGYAKTLADNYHPDQGTIGKILHTMAKRAKNTPIHTVKSFSTVQQLLGPIFENHTNPTRIRGIIEVGGLFKDLGDNATVAEKLMLFIEEMQTKGKASSNIEGVLFFHRDPGQLQPDTLYVFRKGAKRPERVGGTSLKSLEAKGLNPSNYFVYYDEPHTTGTDIPQDPKAVNLITLSKTSVNEYAQGAFRARQYLISQNVECVLREEDRAKMFQRAKTSEDIILSMAKIESLRKSESMIRYFRQQIDNIFRRQAVKKTFELASLLDVRQSGLDQSEDENEETALIQAIECYEPFFVHKMEDQSYLMHGRLNIKNDAKQILIDYLDNKMDRFKRSVEDPSALTEAQKDVEELRVHINKMQSLPSEWEEMVNSIGVEVEVEVQVHQNIEQNSEVEIEQSVEIELQAYEQMSPNRLRYDQGLEKEELLGLIEELRKPLPETEKIISLKEQLKKFKYGLLEEEAHYEDIFSPHIYGTKTFFYTCQSESVLPVFHPLQRPPKQILAVNTLQGTRWLMLSEHEANHARSHLIDLYRDVDQRVQNVWLIQPDGSSLIDGSERDGSSHQPFQLENEDDEYALCELNAFGGNIAYLDDHRPFFGMFLQRNPKLALRFLSLKSRRDDKQNRILRSSPCVVEVDENAKFTPSQTMFQSRINKERLRIGTFLPDNEIEAKILSPMKVRNLSTQYVQYLGIDYDKKDSDRITRDALKRLDAQIIDHAAYPVGSQEREDLLKQKATELTQKQMAMLQDYHGGYITREQLPFLPLNKIAILKNPDQIYDDTKVGDQRYLLDEQQANQFKDSQRHLIPYLNPEFYRKFQLKWQIESVPREHLDKIKEEFYGFLPKQTIKSLTSADREIIEKLPTPKQFSWIHGDLVEEIPLRYLHQVCPEQIAEITNANLIPRLETIAGTAEIKIKEGQWTSWVAPLMVSHLDFGLQLKFLHNKEQIAQLPDEQVPNLDPKKQVRLISDAQVSLLQGKKQIKRCSNVQVRYLTRSQLPYIVDDQVPYLFEAQVKTIRDADRFALLKAEDDPDQGLYNQMVWIDTEQLELVNVDQVKGLSHRQLLDLYLKVGEDKWAVLREGLTKTQIETFDSADLIDLLSEQQIRQHLTSTQVVFLRTQKQIQACPNNLVELLQETDDLKQISLIADAQLPFLRGKRQIAFVRREQVPLLNTVEEEDKVNQVKLLKKKQLPHLAPNQVCGLSNNQLLKLSKLNCWESLRSSITKTQIKTFDKQELVDLLNSEQIGLYLIKSQLPYLKAPWQVQSCPSSLVKHLKAEEQIVHISAEQALFVEGPDQVQKLPLDANYIHKLPNNQLQHTTPEQFKLISDQQISQIDELSFINRLDDSQLSKLGKCGVQACDERNLKRLQQRPDCHHLMAYLCPNQLHLITDHAAAQSITNEQIEAFDAKRYETLDPSHPLWHKNIPESAFDRFNVNRLPGLTQKHPVWQKMTDKTVDQLDIKGLNDLDKKHPIWNRLTPKAVNHVPNDKLRLIPNEKLKYLKDQKQIRTIPFGKVQYLTRDQLRKRSYFQFFTYAVGVVTLGIVGSIVALVAHLTLVPFGIWLVSKAVKKPQVGCKTMKLLHAPTVRMYRLFKVYLRPGNSNNVASAAA